MTGKGVRQIGAASMKAELIGVVHGYPRDVRKCRVGKDLQLLSPERRGVSPPWKSELCQAADFYLFQ